MQRHASSSGRTLAPAPRVLTQLSWLRFKPERPFSAAALPSTATPHASDNGAVAAPSAPQMPLVLEAAPQVLQAPANYVNIVGIGQYKALQPPAKIFLMGIVAGVYIGFGATLYMWLAGNMTALEASSYGLFKLVCALAFPIGLLMVILGGAELYTGNTFTVTCAFLEGKISLADLSRSWALSYSGNFVGSLMLCAAVAYSGIMDHNHFPVHLAEEKSFLPLGQALVRAVMANWLVCIAVFHACAASSLPGKMLGLWGPISAFVAMGLEHSVANMFIISLGIALGAKVTVAQFLINNLLPVTIGNTVAGVVCMALVYAVAYGSLGKRFFKAIH